MHLIVIALRPYASMNDNIVTTSENSKEPSRRGNYIENQEAIMSRDMWSKRRSD
jgi:hypothetical protein